MTRPRLFLAGVAIVTYVLRVMGLLLHISADVLGLLPPNHKGATHGRFDR